jgi:pyrroline-5-carboxylate reductase
MVDKVADEAALAYLSALSGSGAAYPALMAQAMYANALGHGIAPDVAWRAVRSVVCDSPRLFASGPEAVENLIAVYLDYRGITATGINTAVAAGLPASVAFALDAATEKALTFGS